MKHKPVLAGVAALALAAVSACGSTTASPPGQEPGRAVVLVSGTASMTPFTTPTQACAGGYSAGNTYAFLRDALVAQGFAVYTQPVSPGPGPVPPTADETDGPFDDCPPAQPEAVTVNSVDFPQQGGEKLAAFLGMLHEDYGIDEVDLVGHSLGGLFVRNAVREVQQRNVPVTVRSVTTLSSPWEPVMPANPPDQPEVACDGSPTCLGFAKAVLQVPAARDIFVSLATPDFTTWTEAQVGVLDGIPVTLVGGAYFTKPLGNPDKWPNDGIVQLSASLARTTPDSVLPLRSCFVETATHSAFISRAVNDVPETGVTWNDTTVGIVANAIRTAGTDRQAANRLGCPTP